MRRRATRELAASGLVLLTVTGCLDFVQPEPRDAALQASVRVTDDRPADGQITAAFRPGPGPDGSPRSVADPGIVMFGVTIGPTGEGTPGEVLLYRDSLALSAGDLDRAELTIEGPRLFPDHGRASISFPFVWKIGPDSIARPPIGDLELPLRGTPNAPPDDRSTLRWSLTVRGAQEGGSLYSAQGAQVVPDTLEVPREVLEAGAGQTLEARLRVNQSATFPAGDAGYAGAFGLTLEIVWHVVSE